MQVLFFRLSICSTSPTIRFKMSCNGLPLESPKIRLSRCFGGATAPFLHPLSRSLKTGVPDVAGRTKQDQKGCCARCSGRQLVLTFSTQNRKMLVSGRVPNISHPLPASLRSEVLMAQGSSRIPYGSRMSIYRICKYQVPVLFESSPKDNGTT